MNSSNIKTLVIVCALLVITSFIAAGCRSKTKDGWVNTSSMPGQTFAKHAPNSANNSKSTIVYLGNDKDTPNVNFGPKDISFEFKSLKR